MPLYRWNSDNLESVPSTSFEGEHILEEKLRTLLRDQPEVLEEGLFVIAEEFSNWQDSSRSIDLLVLDREGNLVVIELKRTQSGDHSELQAVRYAAMVANMTVEQVIEAHTAYLSKRGIDKDAKLRVLDHLEAEDEADATILTDRPRIILASAGFSTELTTSVLWLRDGGMDISCVKLQLYKNRDGLLMDTMQVIPLPEASDYLVKVREKEEDERRQRKASHVERIPGGEAFIDAIELVREEYKPMLRQLHEWAVSLEREGLAILETRVGSWNTSLWPSLPTANVRLAIAYKTGSSASLELIVSQIRARAPQANGRIEKILGEETYEKSRSPNLKSMPSEELLDALTDAYREANGLPPTTPLPGSGPGSPAPAE